MQRINGGVEIAVFLLQSCELGGEFALIFVDHGSCQPKNAMRVRKIVEAMFRISSLPGRTASGRFCTHNPLQITPKYEHAIFEPHRQFKGVVYTQPPGSNLRSNQT